MVKSIFEAVTPRTDVLKGKLHEDIFAANLDHVYEQTADQVYQDPRTFFENTFPTTGLKSVLAEALGRVTGKSPTARPIIRLETAFGGGKTHSLIALYHLAKKFKPARVAEYVDPDYLPDKPINVAVITGTKLDPVNGVQHEPTDGRDPVTTYTIWGELGYQLGAYSEIAESDRQRIAPGTATIARLFRGQPTIVMMDELAAYLAKTLAVKVEDSTLAEQTLAFFMALLEVAATTHNIAIIFTLAISRDTFGEHNERIAEDVEEALKVIRDAHKLAARVEHVIEPTAENEIAHIVRHRLFEKWDLRTSQAVAKRYSEAIADQIKSGANLPAHANLPGYQEDLEDNYPFHPELITALNENIGTIPNFQKTRGALRLLAMAVRSLWESKPTNHDPMLIHTYHIDLSPNNTIVDELTSRLRRHKYKRVVESDIINPMKGAVSHADMVDHDIVENGRPPYAFRMATTIFLHSLVQGIPGGIVLPQALLAVYAPRDDLGLYESQLERLLNIAFYLHKDQEIDEDGKPIYRIRFAPEPSLPAVVNRRIDQVTISKAKEEVNTLIRRIWKTAELTTTFFPADASDIDDLSNRVQLVVLHYEGGGLDNEDQEAKVRELYTRMGTSGSYRSYRNHLLFLTICDNSKQMTDNVIQSARRFIALKEILNDAQYITQFNSDQKTWFKENKTEAEKELLRVVVALYSALYYPGNGKSDTRAGLLKLDLPSQDTREAETPQQQVIIKTLQDIDKILDPEKPPSPEYIRQKAWPAGKNGKTTPLEIIKEFARKTSLKILMETDILRKTIESGIKSGAWGYYDPIDGCVFTKESYTKTNVEPRIELTDRVRIVLMDAIGDIPVCPLPPKPDPNIKCDKCGSPKSECTCQAELKCDCYSKCGCLLPAECREGSCECDSNDCPCKIDDRPIVVKEEGSPVEAVQRVIDITTDYEWEAIERISVKTDQAHNEKAVNELRLLERAIPQFPRGDNTVEIKLTVQWESGNVLEFDFNGDWKKYKSFHDALTREEKVKSAFGEFSAKLVFTDPVSPEGSEMASLKKILHQFNLGRIEFTAHRFLPSD